MYMSLLTLSKTHQSHSIRRWPAKYNVYIQKTPIVLVGTWQLFSFKLTASEAREGQDPCGPVTIFWRKLCPMN